MNESKQRKYDVTAEMVIGEGRKILLYGIIAPAEPDVGIMSPYIDDWFTEPPDVKLTDEEEEAAVELLNEAIE